MNFPSALERQNMCFAGGGKNQTKAWNSHPAPAYQVSCWEQLLFASACAHSLADGERPCPLLCSHEAAATGLLCMSRA